MEPIRTGGYTPLIRYFVYLYRLVSSVRNWWLYFFQRLGWAKGEFIIYKLRSGLRLTSRNGIDGNPVNEVWVERSYDPNIWGIPFDWSACETIVDVGAHIGTFTLFAAGAAKQARIISVEAEPSNQQMLRKNVENNQLARVEIFPAAITDVVEPQTGKLLISDMSSGCHSVYENKYMEEHTEIDVQCIPLKEVFRRHNIERCDFMKIDCEGCEYPALFNLPPEFFARINMMAIEVHIFENQPPEYNAETLRAHLEKNGFTIIQPRRNYMFATRG